MAFTKWHQGVSRRYWALFCRIASLYRSLLQKRPVILRNLLIEATQWPLQGGIELLGTHVNESCRMSRVERVMAKESYQMRSSNNLYKGVSSYLAHTLGQKTPPPPGGGSYLRCSLIKNLSEQDPPRSTWYKFFEGGPLPPGSWSGNIVNRKPPRGGGVLSINVNKSCVMMSFNSLYKVVCGIELVRLDCMTMHYTAVHRNTL